MPSEDTSAPQSTDTPTFDTLEERVDRSNVDDVWNDGYEAGLAAQHRNMTVEDLQRRLAIAERALACCQWEDYVTDKNGTEHTSSVDLIQHLWNGDDQ